MGWMIAEDELDAFQAQVLRLNVNSRALIQGCAGSGKSVLALHLARQILSTGSQSILVIVFTKALFYFMKAGIKELGLPERSCMLADDWANRNPRPTADYIIVDEVQDFKLEEIDSWSSTRGTRYRATIDAFHKYARKGLLMFGDDAQMIYTDRGTSLMNIMQKLNIKGGFYQNLPQNYRLPKKIACVAEKIMDPIECIEGRCTKEGENRPIIKKCNSRKEEVAYIIDRIIENGLDEVGILVSDNGEAEFIYDCLNQEGMSCEVKHYTVDTLDFSTTNPKIVTYHSSKGLEFKNVFIPFCEINKEKMRNALYVAMTRGKERLYISYSGDLSIFLNNIPENLITRV